MRHKAFLIACANASQYGNNAYIAPGASLSDGLMDVTILEPFTVLDVPALAFQLFNKTLDQNNRIKTFKSKRITIHRSQPGVIHFDGDPVEAGQTIEVEVVEKGLHVCAPPKAAGEGPRPVLMGLKQLNEILEGLKEPGRTLLEESKTLLRRLKDKE